MKRLGIQLLVVFVLSICALVYPVDTPADKNKPDESPHAEGPPNPEKKPTPEEIQKNIEEAVSQMKEDPTRLEDLFSNAKEKRDLDILRSLEQALSPVNPAKALEVRLAIQHLMFQQNLIESEPKPAQPDPTGANRSNGAVSPSAPPTAPTEQRTKNEKSPNKTSQSPPEKKLEKYLQQSAPHAGVSGVEKVRAGLEALQKESSPLDPELQQIKDHVFNPRRVESVPLENGFSILPMGKDEIPEVLPTAELKRQQQQALDRVGIQFDPENSSISFPKEFDLSQLSERDLRITGLGKLARETRPSALSRGEVLLPQGDGKFKVVDGQAYVTGRKADLETAATSGIVMQGLEFQGFSAGATKNDPALLGKITQSLQDSKSELGQALDRVYPGLREQVLVAAAIGAHFSETVPQPDSAPKLRPREAPKDSELSRIWELVQKAEELQKKFALPVGRAVIDPKQREALIKEHREVVGLWGIESLRLSLKGKDPGAYAPPALQEHLKKLAGFTQATSEISSTNYAAQEVRSKARATYVDALADLTRVINPEQLVKTRGAPISWKDPARIEVFSAKNPPPPDERWRFLESEADKVANDYNEIFHKISGPKVSSDTRTYSDLELNQFIRNKANDFRGQLTGLLDTANTYYGGRWAQNQYWHSKDALKIDETISRSLTNLWKESRGLAKQAENDPRLKSFSEGISREFKSVEEIRNKPQELANEYRREAIAASISSVVTVATMGAGSLLFGAAKAGQVIALADLGKALVVGAGVGAVSNLVDVGARRFIDGDQSANLTLSEFTRSTGIAAGMAAVSRVAPGMGDLASAYMGYHGTKASVYAAMEGKYGASAGEAATTLGSMLAFKYIGSRPERMAGDTPSKGLSFNNPLKPFDDPLTSKPSVRRWLEAIKKPEEGESFPKAGPTADARFLVQRSYDYDTGDTSFTGPMGRAIDEAAGKIQEKIKSAKPITADELFPIMDKVAATRKQIAIDKNDPGKEFFGTPLMRLRDAPDPKRAKVEMQDYIGSNGRHKEFFERATEVAEQTVARMRSKQYDEKLNVFGQSFPRSFVARLGDSITVFHPKAETAAPLLQRAIEEWGTALSNPKLSESQFMDKMGEVYTALMHATPYQRGSPAVVEAVLDASLRAKFGKTLGMKTAEPFWEVILAPAKKPVLTGADLRKFFSGKLPEAAPQPVSTVASVPAAPRPPPKEQISGNVKTETGTARDLKEVESNQPARSEPSAEEAPPSPNSFGALRSPSADFEVVSEGPADNRSYSIIHISSGKTVQRMTGTNIRSGSLNPGEIGDYTGPVPPPPGRAQMIYEAIKKDFQQQSLEKPKTIRSTYTDSNARAFVNAYEKMLQEGIPRDLAAKKAILKTPSGLAAKEVFGVEPYDVEIKPAFDRKGNPVPWVEVEFRSPRASSATVPTPTTARAPSSVMDWSSRNSAELGKELISIARKPSSGDAVAKVRSDDAPLYQVNGKHVRGTIAHREARSASIIPDEHVDLYRSAIKADNGDYWAIDSKGNYHRFEQANGHVHWSGSTLLKKPRKPGSLPPTQENPDPIDFQRVPREVLRQLSN